MKDEELLRPLTMIKLIVDMFIKSIGKALTALVLLFMCAFTVLLFIPTSILWLLYEIAKASRDGQSN